MQRFSRITSAHSEPSLDPAEQARFQSAGLGQLPWPVGAYLVCALIPVWFDIGGFSLSLLRMFLLAMAIPALVKVATGAAGRLNITDVLFFCFSSWVGVALAVTSPDFALTQFGGVAVEFLGGYAIARAYVRTPAAFLAMCRALGLMVIFLLPLALLETQTGVSPILAFFRSIPFLDSFDQIRPDPRFGLFRAQTVFAHSIHHGFFCSMVFSLCFVGLRDSLSFRVRMLAAATITVAAFTSVSSAAALAIFLQLGLISWNSVLQRVSYHWWLLFGALCFSYVLVDILSNRSPMRVFMSYATFSPHNAFWRGIIFEWGVANVIGSAEKGIPGSPVFGIGLRSWVRPSYMYSGSMDNFWLVIAVRYGLPGLLFVSAGVLYPLLRVIFGRYGDDRIVGSIRLAWVFTSIGMIFILCTVYVWSTMFSMVFFIFGSGMWLLNYTAAPVGQNKDPGSAVSKPSQGREFRYTRF